MDFLDELIRFTEIGEIVFSDRLILPQGTVVIGQSFPISAKFRGEMATITVRHRSFNVASGEVIDVVADTEEPIQVSMSKNNANIRKIKQAIVQTVAEIPVIVYENIPEKISYLVGSMRGNVVINKAKVITISYRQFHNDGFIEGSVPIDASGNFLIPIRPTMGLLELTIHAISVSYPYVQRAQINEIRQIRVLYPEPQIHHDIPRTVDRLGEDTYQIRVTDAQSIRVNHDNTIHSIESRDGDTRVIDFTIDSSIIRKNIIMLETLSRNDEWNSTEIFIDVWPRTYGVKSRCDAGKCIVKIFGSNQSRLVIPSRSIDKIIPLEGGVISHAFDHEVEGQITVLGDNGETLISKIVFKPKEFKWDELPKLHNLRG